MLARQIYLRFVSAACRKLPRGGLIGLLTAAAFLLPASVDGLAFAQSASGRPSVWLGGMDPGNRSRRFPDKVPSDLYAMFSPGAPWQRLSAGLQAFKLAPNTVLSGSREDLMRVFAGLRQRHIALAMEAGWLVGPGTGPMRIGDRRVCRAQYGWRDGAAHPAVGRRPGVCRDG